MYGPTNEQLITLAAVLVMAGVIIGGGFVGLLWWIFG